MSTAEHTDVATIRETAQRAKDAGLGVTERQLRTWVREGRLRHTMVGRKALLYWPNLLRFLQDGDDSKPTKCNAVQNQISGLEGEIDRATA